MSIGLASRGIDPSVWISTCGGGFGEELIHIKWSVLSCRRPVLKLFRSYSLDVLQKQISSCFGGRKLKQKEELAMSLICRGTSLWSGRVGGIDMIKPFVLIWLAWSWDGEVTSYQEIMYWMNLLYRYSKKPAKIYESVFNFKFIETWGYLNYIWHSYGEMK